MPRFDQAHGGDRRPDRVRRRAARLELCHLPDHGYARRYRPCGQPRGRRPVLRDLHRRPSSPAAAPDGRPVPLQDLRCQLSREGDEDREQAAQAGGDRPLHAGPALSPRRRGGGLPARAVPGRPLRRVREGHPDVLCDRGQTGLDRFHRRPARLPQRPAQSLDRAWHARPVHRAQQSGDRSLLGRGAQEHRHPHLPGRRLRRDPQRRCRLCPAAAQHVQDERRLLSDAARQRAGQGAGLQADRRAQPGGCGRRRAGLLHRGDQPAEPARRDARGGARRPAAGLEAHPEGAPGLDRRLRLLAVQHRRQAQARLARRRRATSPSRRSRRGSKARSWRRPSSGFRTGARSPTPPLGPGLPSPPGRRRTCTPGSCRIGRAAGWSGCWRPPRHRRTG